MCLKCSLTKQDIASNTVQYERIAQGVKENTPYHTLQRTSLYTDSSINSETSGEQESQSLYWKFPTVVHCPQLGFKHSKAELLHILRPLTINKRSKEKYSLGIVRIAIILGHKTAYSFTQLEYNYMEPPQETILVPSSQYIPITIQYPIHWFVPQSLLNSLGGDLGQDDNFLLRDIVSWQ